MGDGQFNKIGQGKANGTPFKKKHVNGCILLHQVLGIADTVCIQKFLFIVGRVHKTVAFAIKIEIFHGMLFQLGLIEFFTGPKGSIKLST